MNPETPVAPGPSTTAPPSRRRAAFMGPLRLRALWRVLLFVLLFSAIAALVRGLCALLHLAPGGADASQWTPGAFAVDEGLGFAVVFAATLVLSRLEHLPLARYGLPLRSTFGARFWEGMIWGFSAVSVVVVLIAMRGGYHAAGFALGGALLLKQFGLWMLAMLLVGLHEEAMFRGFALSALTDGLGFWPAALLLSAGFAAVHYFLKPMENVADALSVGLIGLLLCFSLRRTGSLWFAIGFHAAFDFAALPFYGAPNSGNGGLPIAGHLVAGEFGGPEWLTGGPRGIEASLFVFPVIAVLFVLLHLRFPENHFPTTPRGSAGA